MIPFLPPIVRNRVNDYGLWAGGSGSKEPETEYRINSFLAGYDKTLDNIARKKREQLEKIDIAIQKRHDAILEAKAVIKENEINLTNIASDTDISRKTFYNNEWLIGYVKMYEAKYKETAANTAMTEELNRVKEERDKLKEERQKMLERDMENEDLKVDYMKLQNDYENIDKLNRGLEEQYAKATEEIERLRAKIPSNVVDFDKNDE